MISHANVGKRVGVITEIRAPCRWSPMTHLWLRAKSLHSIMNEDKMIDSSYGTLT